MTERTTLARPYAEAVFRLASEHKALKPWSEMLQLAVAVMQDPQVAALAENPRVPRARFVEFFLDVCGKRLDKDGANFIRLLSENHRLPLLPEIVALYEALPDPKRLTVFKAAGHNDWVVRADTTWWREAITFLLGESR